MLRYASIRWTLHFSPRFVVAATEHLHRRILTLHDRVRQLEDALSTLQAKHSAETHPLLAAKFFCSEDEPCADDSKMRGEIIGDEASKKESIGQAFSSGSNTGDVINAFGTLSTPRHRVSRSFGSARGSQVRVVLYLSFSL